MTQVSLWLSGENRGWPVVTGTRKTTGKTGETSKKKAALTSSSLTTKQVIGLQYFSAPIHPVQLFHLLHTPSGSAADSQGLSHCHRWDLNWQVGLVDFCENWEDMCPLCAQKWWEACPTDTALIRDGKNEGHVHPKRVIQTLEHMFLWFNLFGMVKLLENMS